jgi:hypothetical protein
MRIKAVIHYLKSDAARKIPASHEFFLRDSRFPVKASLGVA